LGLTLILITLISNVVFYFVSHNLANSTTIVEFEFAKTPEDVLVLFTNDGEFAEQIVKAADYVNIIDFGFLTIYSIFLMLLFLKIQEITQKKYFYYGLIITIVTFFADLFENVQLLSITKNLMLQDLTKDVELLHIITWIKWGSISISFFLLSFYYFRRNIAGRIIGIISVVPFVVGIIYAIVGNGLELYFVYSVFLAFGASIIWCFIFKHNLHKKIKFADSELEILL